MASTEKQPRVLVTGAHGLLGVPTAAAFRSSGWDVAAPGHADLDIRDEAAVQRVMKEVRPRWVVNCAAYTRVDDCEDHFDEACAVNGEAVGILARAAAVGGAGVVHLSTDYVFEGAADRPYDEDHPTGAVEALSAYGRSKLLGEQRLRAAHPSPTLVRTAWLFGPDGPGFPNAILNRAAGGEALRVVNDQTGSPTYAPDLAGALVQLAMGEATGVFHITNSGQCSWYEFARVIIDLSGFDVDVQPATTAEVPRRARRPAYSVLSNRLYVERFGRPLRPWREAIADYIALYRAGRVR